MHRHAVKITILRPKSSVTKVISLGEDEESIDPVTWATMLADTLRSKEVTAFLKQHSNSCVGIEIEGKEV